MFFDEEDNTPDMPFVLTQEFGGEYDDDAFTAGWHLSTLDTRLTLAEMAGLVIPPIVLPESWRQQADLMAMSKGLMVQVTPIPDQPGFAVFIFAPAEAFESEEDED